MKRRLLGITAAALLVATQAISADLAPVEPIPEQPPEVAVASASGWYLRGDVGYAWNDLRGARYFQGSNDNLVSFDKADVDDSWTLGAGVGYQVTDYFRT